MIEGLQQTTTFLHDLLRQEAELIGGPKNLVLGGLSQGCAAGLVATLLWEGGRLGAIVGMCGWLPFKGVLETAAGVGSKRLDLDGNLDDLLDFDPFGSSPVDPTENGLDLFEHPHLTHAEGKVEGGNDGTADPCAKAIFSLREAIELQGAPFLHGHPSITTTPVFLGHGVEDERVPAQLGQESAECLEALGIPIYWHEYQSLGHWYSEAMLADLVHFLQGHTGWETG
jgi:predicted esterase